MLTNINKEGKSFQFQMEVKGVVTYWECFLDRIGTDMLVLDMPKMILENLPFTVRSLGSCHHKFSLKDFTASNMSNMGKGKFLQLLTGTKVISDSDQKKIILELDLKDEIGIELLGF